MHVFVQVYNPKSSLPYPLFGSTVVIQISQVLKMTNLWEHFFFSSYKGAHLLTEL